MYNKDFFINIITILLLALAQVFIFNHINFLGSYQPYIYVVFVLFYPPYQSRYLLLLLAFILGLSIDILEYTGGIHAFALTFIAFYRNTIIKLLAGKVNFEMEYFNFNSFSISQWIFYLTILIIFHHSVLLLLENFKFTGILTVLTNALISSGITFIFVLIYKILFKNKILV
ncbi:rod shape-determining protein MreD [Faecalibacter bovis]|uniref:Rod shape-determining protein MreD n=1 Tax=Faecalibacter bovis TaxID=2898187 RepID=A0ABX7XDP7_9FLAO|nr:rod shape-determining protein MreD [Faecalibacter bovis]QTV06018.1 rod shape-determining protein MreD [Faecalibacter bovis]